jgi:hypothetical protein
MLTGLPLFEEKDFFVELSLSFCKQWIILAEDITPKTVLATMESSGSKLILRTCNVKV